jgi:hypothetical protein
MKLHKMIIEVKERSARKELEQYMATIRAKIMRKLKMQTPNLVDKNVEQIAGLFPEVITEIKDKEGNIIKGIDFDLLKQKLSHVLVEDENERYRLDWPGKRASLLKANTLIKELSNIFVF